MRGKRRAARVAGWLSAEFMSGSTSICVCSSSIKSLNPRGGNGFRMRETEQAVPDV